MCLCSVSGPLYSLSGLCIICRGFVKSVKAVYSLLGRPQAKASLTKPLVTNGNQDLKSLFLRYVRTPGPIGGKTLINDILNYIEKIKISICKGDKLEAS